MTVPLESVSVETHALPDDEARERAELTQRLTTRFPDPDPVEQGWIEQAVCALIELKHLARVRATRRNERIRTAVLDWEQDQEDTVTHWVRQFGKHAPSALVGLLRSAAGCRWAIDYWTKLDRQLKDNGTWLGEFRMGAIQLQGHSAYLDELFVSEDAYLTWLDCLGANPNPKQRDIDLILDWRHIPKTIQDRDIVLWPRDREACRARLRAIVDRELPRLKALEETLRVQYELPAKAEARVMALASVTREDMQLLRAEQIHEQSYQRAVTALLKARRQSAAAAPRREAQATEPAREPIDPWSLKPVTRWAVRRALRRDEVRARAGAGPQVAAARP
jgi:hypothetical protein